MWRIFVSTEYPYLSKFNPKSKNAKANFKSLALSSSKIIISSFIFSFSVWNTILGSSLLTMPWGIQMAGFFPGIILVLAMGGLCLYTAYRLIVVHQYHGELITKVKKEKIFIMTIILFINYCFFQGSQEKIEVVQLSRIYLNKWVEYIARIFSISVLLGATIAYWILMSNFLYNSVNFFYGKIVQCQKCI